jgi:NADPH:quinone reductase-like Zn-dependent oxidoreductase
MTMLKAQYDRRGPVPHEVIRAVPLELPPPAAGQALVAMLASPINPSNLLTLTGEYAVLPALPAVGGSEGVGRIAALDVYDKNRQQDHPLRASGLAAETNLRMLAATLKARG